MQRRSSLLTIVLGASVVFLGACKDKDLEVTNPNAGDTKRVLATPVDAENLLGQYFKRFHNAWYNGNPPTTLVTLTLLRDTQVLQKTTRRRRGGLATPGKRPRPPTRRCAS